MSSLARPRVFILHSEPLHLNLYSLIVEGGGYEAVPGPVTVAGRTTLPDEVPDAVLLDHDLNIGSPLVEIGKALQLAYPGTPVILLSRFTEPPEALNPYIAAVVQKGNPKRLLGALDHYVRSGS